MTHPRSHIWFHIDLNTNDDLNIKTCGSHGTRKFSPVHPHVQLRRDLCFGGNWTSNSVSMLWIMGTLGEGLGPGREG